jgi:carboxypeptidase Taq
VSDHLNRFVADELNRLYALLLIYYMALSTQQSYSGYTTKMSRIADLRYSSALLQWDQETYLPPKGAAKRGQQIATLNELAHEIFTSEALGETLDNLLQKTDLPAIEKRNVQLTADDYSRQQKIPGGFVREMSEIVNQSFHSWMEARRVNDFKIF